MSQTAVGQGPSLRSRPWRKSAGSNRRLASTPVAASTPRNSTPCPPPSLRAARDSSPHSGEDSWVDDVEAQQSPVGSPQRTPEATASKPSKRKSSKAPNPKRARVISKKKAPRTSPRLAKRARRPRPGPSHLSHPMESSRQPSPAPREPSEGREAANYSPDIFYSSDSSDSPVPSRRVTTAPPSQQTSRLVAAAARQPPRGQEPHEGQPSAHTPRAPSQGYRRRRREVAAPHFDGKDVTFSDYLLDFSRVAHFNSWNEEEKCFHLWNSIVGTARIKILALPFENKWDELLNKLKRVFSTERAVEAHRMKWLDVKRDPELDLETFAHYLLDLSRKANPLSLPEEQERFAKEKFIETAGTSQMKFWLRALKPTNLQDAIDLATQYELASQAMKPGKPDLGHHVAAVIPDPCALPSTSQGAAVTAAAETTSVSQAADMASKICETIKSTLAEGLKSWSKPKDTSKFCRYCKKRGHEINECRTLMRKESKDSDKSFDKDSNGTNGAKNKVESPSSSSPEWQDRLTNCESP